MQIPVQISFEHMPRSEALEARIRAGVAKLEQFQPRLTSCRVVVEHVDRHHHQGGQFRVKVEARAPGREQAIATLQHHEDVFVAVRDAFDAARRQIEDEVREARGDVKVHPSELHGTVARLDIEQGFGFIETQDGRELYFSRDNVVNPAFDQLEPGTAVRFIEEPAGEGVQAKRVSAGRHRFE